MRYVPYNATMKLHIEFSVRDPETERYVTFADDVEVGKVRDWFVRASLGIEQLFDMIGAPRMISIENASPQFPKIMAIKLVRELSGMGLREAKDAVDHGIDYLSPILVCDDGRDAKNVVARFRQEGIAVKDGPFDAAIAMNSKALRVRPMRTS